MPSRSRFRRAAGGVLPWAAMALVCWWLVVPLRRSDLMVFLAAGNDVLHGADPYPALQDPALYGGSAFVYPWWTALAFAPLGALPTHLADLIWTAGSIAAVLAACRVAGVRGICSPLVVLLAATSIRGLQVGSLNALLLLGCVVAYRYRDRPWLVGTALALVVGAKVFLFPLLLWPLVSRRWAAVRATAVVLGLLLAVSFGLGPIGPFHYAHMLSSLGAHEGLQGIALHRALATAVPGAVATVLCVAAAAVVLSHGTVQRLRRGERADLLLFACCVVAALLLTPIVWTHYLLLLFGPLLLARARLPVLAGAAALSWLAAGPALTGVLLSMSPVGRIALVHAAVLALLVALTPRRSAVDPARELVAA